MPEGDIVVNPQTGERRVLRGGQWVPEGAQPSSQPAPAPAPQPGGWSIQPMQTPAQQQQEERDAYQRRRNEQSDAREAERLRLSQEAAARERAKFERENAGGVAPAGAEARTRLTLNLGPLVEAQRTMQDMEGRGYSYNQDWGARALEAVPLDGGALARVAGGQDYQQYDQAARSFEAAVMPIMSGAAVTPSEAQRQIRANIPQFGDTPEVLAAKSRNRQMMINAAAALVGQQMPFPDVGIYGLTDQNQQQPDATPQGGDRVAPFGVSDLITGTNGAPGGPSGPSVPRTPPNLDELSRDAILALNLQAGDEVIINGERRIMGGPPTEGPIRDRVFQDERGLIFRELDPAALRDARERAAQTPGQLRSFNEGATFNLSDELVGVASGLETRALNLGRRVTGQDIPYTGQQADDAVRFAERERQSQFARERPVQDFAFRMAGGLLAPGSRGAGRFVAGDAQAAARATNPVARLMASPTLAPQGVRGAAVGAAAGAAYGFGGAQGSAADRLDEAAQGAQVGAATGLVAPAAGRVVGAAFDRVVAPPIRGAIRAVNRMTGGKLLNANTEARRRLAEAMTQDGLDQQTITRAMQDWEANGGPSASFLDIISANGGGQNTRALIRGAAMQGPARNVATQYTNRVEADIQGTAINRTRELTPDQRTVPQARTDLEAGRSAQAQADYAGPYRARVTVTPEVQSALGDAPGRNAIARARAAAEARRDTAQVAELDALLSDNPPTEVSAGTLDRIRIALGGRGERLAQNPATRDIAGGLFDRAGGVDTVLEGVDAIAPARANYRDASQQIEGLDMGAQVRNASPDRFAADMAARPGASVTAPLGAARALEDTIGRPAEGSTGALNTISSSTNVRRNLETVFGRDAAGRYQAAIGQIVEQVRNGRFINPNTGSQTAGRAVDESLVAGSPASAGFWVNLWRKLSTGQTTLTDQEREAIVKLATSSPQGAPPPQARMSSVTPGASPAISGYVAGSNTNDPRARMTRPR